MTTVTHKLPSTNFERPNLEELKRLFGIVTRRHPGLVAEVDLQEFGRAFYATGHCFRLKVPDQTRSFAWFTDYLSAWLVDNFGTEGISGSALFAAVVWHSDIPYRVGNPKAGEIAELAIDPYGVKGAPCTTPNTWRLVIEGAPLRLPVSPRGDRVRQVEAQNQVQYYEKATNGDLRRTENLWSKT
jgi:hypothetical protein